MNYFLGQKLTDEEKKKGYVSYKTLADTMNTILITEPRLISMYYYFDIYNGSEYDKEDEYPKQIYQSYIIDEQGAKILKEYTNELVYFVDGLDIYIWCICHFGTPWGSVNTNIKIGDFEK